MRQKCIAFLLLLSLVAAALTGGALAEDDPVESFARSLGNFETEIQVPVRDFDALMQETFNRYPELFLYYGGCSYLSVPEGLELEVQYQNTDVPREEIRVVDSDDKLMAAMGLCLGPKLIVLAFFIGCVSAAVVSLVLMAAKKVGRRSLIPLGPFLALGSAAAAFWGDGLISWYLTLF